MSTAADRLRNLEGRAQRMLDIVRGLGARRRDARESMQRLGAVVSQLESWRGKDPDPTQVAEAKRAASEAEGNFKLLDREWSHESQRLQDAQALAERCRDFAEREGIVASPSGIRWKGRGAA